MKEQRRKPRKRLWITTLYTHNKINENYIHFGNTFYFWMKLYSILWITQFYFKSFAPT